MQQCCKVLHCTRMPPSLSKVFLACAVMPQEWQVFVPQTSSWGVAGVADDSPVLVEGLDQSLGNSRAVQAKVGKLWSTRERGRCQRQL